MILDNIASLTPGIAENSKEDWDPVNQWLISLRHLGVSVLLIHHSGKGGAQRGTSGREDALDCIIKLKPGLVNSGEYGAAFGIRFEKARNVAPDQGIYPFDLELVEDGKGGVVWERTYEKDGEEE